MTWEEALTYDHLVHDVAREWAHRVHDPSMKDDLVNHLYIRLVKKVKTDNANNKTQYVRAALWKQAEKFMRSRNNRPWNYQSLDRLMSQGVQIDTKGNHYSPYSGEQEYTLLDDPSDR